MVDTIWMREDEMNHQVDLVLCVVVETDGRGTSTTRGVFQLAVSPLQKTRPLTNNYMKVK